MKNYTENIFKLLQVKGMGRIRILKMAEKFDLHFQHNGTLADMLLEFQADSHSMGLHYNDLILSFDRADALAEESANQGIKTISIYDSEYPQSLKNTANFPLVLHIRGTVNNLQIPSVAVIGTRNPSEYGRKIGERIGFVLGDNGINVVSGLAIGCDTSAHIGSLRANGVTTAVMAQGLDSVYPKENKSLCDKIIETGGTLVSEYPIKTRAFPHFFVERDRIQAGLSTATIVVETDIKGGTMHTVDFTLKYARLLYAFDHPIEKQTDSSRGNQMLIREKKAKGLQSKEDIDILISIINPGLDKADAAESKSQIEDVQLPLFNEDDFNDLYTQKEEKVKKPRKKKSKATATQTQAFRDESDI